MRNHEKAGARRRRKSTSEPDTLAEQPTVIEGSVESVTRIATARPRSASTVVAAPRARRCESDREAVLSANAMFYRAFEVRDIELMGQLWANAPHVRCIHPGWEPLFGWDEVIGSWEQIFGGLETLRFELADVSVRVGGDLAWVELSEMLEAQHEGQPARSQVLATNLFERGADGRWRLIHHHASPVLMGKGARRAGTALH